MSEKANFRALLPMIVFLVLFIGTGIALTATGADMPFYQLSATVAIIPAIVLAILQGKDDLNKKIGVFLSGVGEINIITMCMIFLLAGGFASVASAIGGVKATVNFGLSLLPPSMILPGLFLIGAFISTAMGTSMGTVAAIAPIAVGVGEQTDIPLALLLGVVMSGAMFGDNLSMISDTTIAATRTQGCEMKDKFRMNLLIALPAALVTLALLWFAGASGQVVKHEEYQFIRDALRLRGIGTLAHPSEMLEYRMVPLLTELVQVGNELSASAMTRGLDAPNKRTNVCRSGFHAQDIIAFVFCAVVIMLFIISKVLGL